MKIIIIEDEARARNLLNNIIQLKCKDIQLVMDADNLRSGVELIKKVDANLVFLDIEMPGESGLNILNYFEEEEINFDIVFTTAYSEYGVKAFDMNAIDYLLKPLRPNKVVECVEKSRERMENKQIKEQLLELKKSLKSNSFQKIGLPISDGILFVDLSDIIHLEADGMYTKIFIQGTGKKVVSKPLKFFTTLMKKSPFFYRPHRSHMVNINHMKQYVRKDGHYIILGNNQIIPITKDKREEFLSLINLI